MRTPFRAFAVMVAAFAIACGPTPVEPPPPPPPPRIVSFLTPPLGSVEKGASIGWQVTGATTCSASWHPGVFPCSGQETYTPGTPATVEFTLSATGPGGTVTRKDTTRFVNEPVAVITPPSVNLELGQSVEFEWRCLNSSPTAQSWSAPPQGGNAGKFTFTATAEGNFTQTLDCGNELGTVRASASAFAYSPLGLPTEVGRPDSVPGAKKIVPVYYVASDGPNLSRDINGEIAEVIRTDALDGAAQTGMILAVDTYHGEYDVLRVRSRHTTSEIVAAGANQASFMLAELRERGLAQEGDSVTKYLFFAEVPSNYACGSAILDGTAAGLYLRGMLDGKCSNISPFTSWWAAWSHELGHAMGAVCRAAPNFDSTSEFHSIVLGDRMNRGVGLDIDKARVDYWGPNAPPGCDISRKGWFKPAPPSMVAAGKALAALRALEPIPTFEFREVLERKP